MAASAQAPAAAAAEDPVHEWLDDGDSYLLHLKLQGFKKEDLRVHVDGDGRLTVVGHRKPTRGGGDGKAMRLHKVFQLPNTANLDTITGRFSNNVLTLTVPKLPAAAGAAADAPAPPPPPPPTPTQAKEEEEARLAAAGDKPADDQEDPKTEAEDRTSTSTSLTTDRSEEEEHEKKATPMAPPPPPPPASEKATGDHQKDDHQQDGKAATDDHRAMVAREAARRIEAARARVAEAKAKAERERKCEHWKERAMEEGMKLAEAVSRKKEVVATAVAAFTLGVFVSSRLFSKN